MYIPKLYRSDDEVLMKKIIRKHGFALLISCREKLAATHAMFLLKEKPDHFYLETHISKANPQADVLQNGDEVLCDFLGKHAYISSSWYNHLNVSTWNYEAVQVRGTVQLMTDDELYAHLAGLTAQYEMKQKCPVLVEDMGEAFVQEEMKGAFGISVIPTEIHIASKLSQNRKQTDFRNIIAELEQGSEGEREIAAKMRKLLQESH
ncbi:FMN-binding negative transcriptional regulator [Chryseobacterium sp. MFBS3-17]|uniref:FMN-binding negative transcriptional regulator n=1 Tax=Chryseobacterium sp. MFBS3-17 TaxID=2886689 RepID=UPI001D0EE57F|nr:FMN-binding negative transcriptional regulator [Chryseobacterium sp. MFBS3-17]MCC2589750.1 FMN-binding negative transcriptional regulator [Chryseobacterium sp. MFBS3-17]